MGWLVVWMTSGTAWKNLLLAGLAVELSPADSPCFPSEGGVGLA